MLGDQALLDMLMVMSVQNCTRSSSHYLYNICKTGNIKIYLAVFITFFLYIQRPGQLLKEKLWNIIKHQSVVGKLFVQPSQKLHILNTNPRDSPSEDFQLHVVSFNFKYVKELIKAKGERLRRGKEFGGQRVL